ncbi:cytosine permease [Ihubacter massiliensis]|uniref:cytosine permease n=1 Tax=Ihubacter massiliensis TaxID=1852367 RepID=UPI0011DCB0A4|nr:cytosine permease [Ihubacter massiliensis]MCO7123000.1 cytosine permease [Ihubacter massiliensis]
MNLKRFTEKHAGGKDFAPRPYKERKVTPFRMIAIWFAMAVSLVLFIESADLFDSLTVGEIFVILIIAHTLLCVLMWFTQDMGIKYGIPFSVSLRPSFGYLGSIFPTFFRGIPGLFWFGYQTWVGAEAINALTSTVWGFSNITLFILLMGAIQIIHTCFGISAVSRLSNLASPLLLAVMIYMLYALLTKNHVTIGSVFQMTGTGEGSYTWVSAILVYIGGWITMALSISDITRECKVEEEDTKDFWKSTKKYMIAQWVGLVPVSAFFGTIGAIGVALTGEWNPISIMVKVIGPQNEIMLVICLIFVLLATWATNDTGNLYPAAYAFMSLVPKKINFALGVLIAGTLGLVIRPWAVGGNILTVITAIGYLLAPISGILIVDYYILRKRQLNVEELYHFGGQYKYWNNINPAGVIANIIGLVVSIPFWDYVFFVGLVIGGIVYYILMKTWIVKKYPQPEIK